jgi:hypothetical protein
MNFGWGALDGSWPACAGGFTWGCPGGVASATFPGSNATALFGSLGKVIVPPSIIIQDLIVSVYKISTGYSQVALSFR